MAFQGLSVNVSGDSASAITSLEATESALSGTDRAADSAADSMEEFGDEVTITTGKLAGLSGSASTARGSLSGLVPSRTVGRMGSLLSTTGKLSGALAGVGAVATPLISTLGGVGLAAGGLASGFGAVVGSGLIAFGEKRGEQNEERLEQIQARIEELETLREETGELTDKQEDELEQLEEQADKTEELTGVTGGLKDAFGDLQEEITPLITDLGQKFIPLIEDAFDAVPTLVERIIDGLGPLDRFKNALRDAGQTVLDNAKPATEAILDLGRDALPVLRDFSEFVVTNAGPAFDTLVETTKDLGPTLVDAGQGVADVIPKLNDFGTTLLNDVIPRVGGFVDSAGDMLARIRDFADESGLVDAAQNSADAVGNLLGKVRDTEAFQSFKSTVESDLSAVSEAISQAADGEFDNALGTLVDRAGTRIQEIATLIGGKQGKGGVINNAIEDLSTFLQGDGQSRLVTASDEAFSTLSDAAHDVKTALVGPDGQSGIFKTLIVETGELVDSIDFESAFEGLEDAAEGTSTAVRNTLVGEDGSGGLSQTVGDALMGVQEFLQTEGETILTEGSADLMEAMVNSLTDLRTILIGPKGRSGILAEMSDAGQEFLSDTVPKLLGGAMENIGRVIRLAFKDIFVKPIQGKESVVWSGLKSGVNFLVQEGPDLLVAVGEMIIDSIIEGAQGLFDGLVGNSVLKDGIWDAADWLIENVGDKLGDVGGAIMDGIKNGITGSANAVKNAIIGPLNSGIELVNDVLPDEIDVPQIGPFGGESVDTGPAGKIPGVPDEVETPQIGPFGGGDVDIPGLPLDTVELAEGGIVTEETFARIGEGGQPEAVVPRYSMPSCKSSNPATATRSSQSHPSASCRSILTNAPVTVPIRVARLSTTTARSTSAVIARQQATA